MSVSMMFEHALDQLKGWPSPTAVDKDAKLSSNVTATVRPVPPGRVVHLNSVGEFEMGASGTQVAIFLLNGEESFDVSNPTTLTAAGAYNANSWYAVAPTGKMSGLVATGAYELATTEYDPDPAITFAPNAHGDPWLTVLLPELPLGGPRQVIGAAMTHEVGCAHLAPALGACVKLAHPSAPLSRSRTSFL